MRSTPVGCAFEWAEGMGKALRSPVGFAASVSALCDWLEGYAPAALCLAKLQVQPLKVFSHVAPVCIRSVIEHPQSDKCCNYIVGRVLSNSNDV